MDEVDWKLVAIVLARHRPHQDESSAMHGSCVVCRYDRWPCAPYRKAEATVDAALQPSAAKEMDA